MGGGKEVVKLLVGNKVDQQRVVPREQADEWARSRGMLFMEASAKTKEGISQVFNEVVQKVCFVSVNVLMRHRFLRTQHCCPTPVPLSLARRTSMRSLPTLEAEDVAKCCVYCAALLFLYS